MSDLYKGFLEYESVNIDKYMYLKSEVYKFNRKFDNCIMVKKYDIENDMFHIYLNKSIDKDLFERISSNYEFDEEMYLTLSDTFSYDKDYYKLIFETDWTLHLSELIDVFVDILIEYAKIKRIK
jgi:hypothetical protein